MASEPQPGVSVRVAAPFDSAAIARVQVASWQAAYRSLMPDSFLDALSPETRAEQWHTILREAERDERTWAGIHDGVLAGFASAGPSRDFRAGLRTGEIYALYTLPGAWGSGLGAELLREATTWLPARGFEEATLWVLAENARARSFFERDGWEFDGLEMDVRFGDRRVAEMRYRKRLPLE